ncbi:MAG TPA: DUF4153 domain-containing protein [Longimicrobium sp.]|jgi:hypothetical protein
MKLPALRAYLGDARDAFVHAPVEVLIGACVAVTFSIYLRAERPADDWWVRVFMAAVIALPLVFAASVLRARGVISAAARWGATAAALLAAGAFVTWIFDPDLASERWRATALVSAAWLGLTLVPLAGGGDEAARRWRFWRFDALLLARIVTVGLYGAALYLALAGAVSAVTSLFELDAPDHLYQDLAGAVFFALVPWVVAGGVPALAAEVADRSSVPLTAVRRVGRYLYAVVLVVYLAILFAYTVKVIATGDLPKNILSPIVLFAGLGGLLGGIFLEPLLDDPESRGVGRLIRAFPALLLPLLPLPIWAVGVRQDQYGWTEFRYLRFVILLALLVLAVVGTVRLVRRRPPLLALVPALLAAALLLASVGPWSAQAVSRRDQSARLRSALDDAGLMRGGRLVRPLLAPKAASTGRVTLPPERYERVTGTLQYLFRAHGPAAAGRVMGADLRAYEYGEEVIQALAIREGCRVRHEVVVWGELPEDAPIPLRPGTLYRAYSPEMGAPAEAAVRGGARIALEPAAVRVDVGARRVRADLAPLVSRIRAKPLESCEGTSTGPTTLTPSEARVSLTDEQGRARGELIVTRIGYGSTASDTAGRPLPPLRLIQVQGLAVVWDSVPPPP